MKNKKTNSSTSLQNVKPSKKISTPAPMESSELMKLFEKELKDLYRAEKAVTKAIRKMIKNATSQELIDALTSHLAVNGTQVTRLEQVFKSVDIKAISKKCEAMEGIIKDGGELIESCEAGPMCDAGIISAAQKVQHYEIASYGTLRQFAETLGLSEAESLLEATLIEEKATDVKLTEVAVYNVNIQAREVVKTKSNNEKI